MTDGNETNIPFTWVFNNVSMAGSIPRSVIDWAQGRHLFRDEAQALVIERLDEIRAAYRSAYQHAQETNALHMIVDYKLLLGTR